MSKCKCNTRERMAGVGCYICNPKVDKDWWEKYMVGDLLNFFEIREGEHVSEVDIEETMDRAAARIEELEAREVGYIQSLRELEAELIACKDSNAALSDACLDWEAKNVKLEARVRELEAENAELKDTFRVIYTLNSSGHYERDWARLKEIAGSVFVDAVNN